MKKHVYKLGEKVRRRHKSLIGKSFPNAGKSLEKKLHNVISKGCPEKKFLEKNNTQCID